MAFTEAPVAVPVSRLFPLQDMSAREIAARIAARDIPAAEIVEHFIARLKTVNNRLNAVTVELFDSARKTAAKFDEALLRGEKLAPLAGLPVTVKECFDLAGTASTFGLPSRRDVIETADDPYVAALRAAGAIPIAKTNVPQLLIFTESDNPLYGRTNNPWNVERSCGGSSGGEAALIAAGASPLGLGNDIGGSLRVPAAFCGITSIRPTAGRTPDRCGHGLPIGQQAIISASRTSPWRYASSNAPAIPSSNQGRNWAIRQPSTSVDCALPPSPMTANFRSRRRRGARSPKRRRCSLPPERKESSGASRR